MVEKNNSQCKKGIELEEILKRKLAKIHFSSVLDLNGDCRNDLFIHSETQNLQTDSSHSFEFYIRLENGNYCLTSVYTIPSTYIV